MENHNNDLDVNGNCYFDENNNNDPHFNKPPATPPNNNLLVLTTDNMQRSSNQKKKKKKKKKKHKLKPIIPLHDTLPAMVELTSMGKLKHFRSIDCANVAEHNNNTKPVFATADTGATGTYLKLEDIGVIRDIILSSVGDQVVVAVADGTLLKSTHHGFLNIPGHGKIIAHVLPQLKGSLLSISQLVDLGLHVTHCSKWVKAVDINNNIVLQGPRDTKSGLWKVDLQQLTMPATGTAEAAIRLDSAADFVHFWHASYGSPAVSTFVATIDNGYIRVPGLTATKVRRHLSNTIATAQGHLTATKKGIQSTKQKTKAYDTNEAPVPEDQLPAEKRLWIRVEDIKTGRMHADAAGALPMRARSGALYQIIFYNEDTNYIHVETTTSRGGPQLLSALQRAVTFFNERGVAVKLIRMDNECAQLTKDWVHKEHMSLELTPVAVHRTNKAERAIQTWKDHFIATLATTDPDCPVFLWEDFIEQTELTLNSMRASKTHPLLSAWEALCGKFDIMATPIAPLGTKVLVHDTPENRGTWQVHGSSGFYIGRALLHYRCHNVWMTDTRALRVSNCLAWFPTLVKMPGSSHIEELTAAVTDVRNLLRTMVSENPEILQPGVDIRQVEQLREIRNLFSPPPTRNPNTDTWPRGQQIMPPSHNNLRIADALPDHHPAPYQRVPTGQIQRVPTTPPQTLPAVPLQRVQVDVPAAIIIPLQPNQQVRPPLKLRNKHHYLELSNADINKLPKSTFNCIGKQFVDDEDPSDTTTGVTIGIERHKKSRKLVFKYWNHHLYDSAPNSPLDYDYIDVKYALSRCKWSKYKPPTTRIAAAVNLEDGYRNAGMSLNSKKKARQRQRYVPWWHKRSNSINSAITELRNACQKEFRDYTNQFAFTALDLNVDGSRLTSASALKGPYKEVWEKAHGEEIIRLVESQTGRFIHRSEMPIGRKAAYYNPQLKIKVKSEGTIYRVRGTIEATKLYTQV